MVFKKHFVRWWKGKHHTEESKLKISEAKKGIKFSQEHKDNLKKAWVTRCSPPNVIGLITFARSEKGRNIARRLGKSNYNEKHYFWKGDKVGYRALHAWLVRKLGKANHCTECGLSKIPKGMKRYFQWANISHKYKRDLTDWKQLCIKCHKQFDKK